MPCLITALKRSAVKKTTRKNKNNKISENKNFTAKTQYLMQSDKTLTVTTKSYFFLNITHIKIFFNESKKKFDKKIKQ